MSTKVHPIHKSLRAACIDGGEQIGSFDSHLGGGFVM